MKKQFSLLSVAAMVVLASALSTPAWATLTVDLNAASCSDGALCDTNGAANAVSWSTTVNGATITISVAASDVAGVGALAWTINGTPTATGTFTFAISDNGFTAPAPTNLFLAANVSGTTGPSIGGNTGVAGNLVAQGYFGGTPSNTTFTTNGGTTGSFTSSSFNGTTVAGTGGPFSDSSPYSLTEDVTVNITALATAGETDKAFQVNGNVSTVASAIPEPASVSLLGGVLLLTAGAIRRRMNRA